MSDSAETTLFNMIRGAGVSGLGGMKYLSGPYIRPLLDVSRKEIEEYAKEQGIPYRHDSTNDDLSLARNRIRAHIIRSLRALTKERSITYSELPRYLRKKMLISMALPKVHLTVYRFREQVMM